MPRTVLITRPKAQAQELIQLLEQYGFHCELCPTIEICALTDWLSSIPPLYTYHGIFFTSANGVEHFLAPLRQHAPDLLLHLNRLTIYAVGPKTADALSKFGLKPSVVPDAHHAEALGAILTQQNLAGQKFLFVRGKLAQRTLPEAVRAAGATCDECEVYDTRLPSHTDLSHIEKLLVTQGIHVIAFMSPSAVKNFHQLFERTSIPSSIQLAAIGHTTAQAIEQLYGRVDILAPAPSSQSLAEAIAAACSSPST
jgi:uroporphyrinogen-III synthase